MKTYIISFMYNPNRRIVAKAGPSVGVSILRTNDTVLMNMCAGIEKFIKTKGG